MRKFLLFIFSLCAATTLFAQDVIITKDAKKINAKVTEIGVFVIKYKLAAETDGPTYVMPKSKIAAVTYASGRVETYVDGVTISSDSSAGGVTDSAAFVAATASSHDTVVSDTVSSYSQHAPVPPYGEEHYRHYRAPRQEVANDDFGDEQPDLATRGLRFKIDVAPLFGGKVFYEGYRRSDGYYYSCDSSHSVKAGLQASASIGYQFNRLLYFGGGIDVASMDKWDWTAISEFVDLNVTCMPGKVSPIVGFRLGISSEVGSNDCIGSFLEPSVGFVDHLTPKVSWGITFGYRASYFDINDDDDDYSSRSGDSRYYDDNKTMGAYFTKLFLVF
jgi:hypothetical protein